MFVAFCFFFLLRVLFFYLFLPSVLLYVFPCFGIRFQPVSWLSLPVAARLATETQYAG
jgi:hypothetical protein